MEPDWLRKMKRNFGETNMNLRSSMKVDAAALETPTITPGQRFSKSRKLVLGTVLLVLAAGLFLLLRPAAEAPPPSIMLLPDGFPRYKPTLFERYVPVTRKWGWAWRTRDFVCGVPKPIDLRVTIWSCTELPVLPSRTANYANTNGVQLWFLADAELQGLWGRLTKMPGNELISAPRVSTSSGVECAIQSGSFGARLLSYVQSARTDLYAHFVETDNQSGGRSSITNLDVALRIQIPKSNGGLSLE
jgi:hypothetical protein